MRQGALTRHEETVVQDGDKVRVCVSVVHLLPDEVKYLGSTFSVYVHLGTENTLTSHSPYYAQPTMGFRKETRSFYLPTQNVAT